MADETLTVDLLRNAKDGNAAARNRLFERYLPRVLKIVRMMMGKQIRQQVDSQDLAQDTLYEAVRRLEGFQFQGPGSLLRWLKTLARSAICAQADRGNAAKRAHKEVSINLNGEESNVGALEPQTDAPGPPAKLVLHEEQTRLESSIAELPDKHRDLILLRHYAEQSWAEIAAEMGHPSPDAARMAYVEAKAQLVRVMCARGKSAGEGQ